MSDRPGYRITKGSREALAAFRKTLPPAESDPRPCPPGCTADHDAKEVTDPVSSVRQQTHP